MTMTDTPDLKPCPACGGEAMKISMLNPPFVRCINQVCYIQGPYGLSKQEAAEKWNALPRLEDTKPEPPEGYQKVRMIVVGDARGYSYGSTICPNDTEEDIQKHVKDIMELECGRTITHQGIVTAYIPPVPDVPEVEGETNV